MSFPDRNTFVPAIAPAKRGPHPLKVQIPQTRLKDADFTGYYKEPKLSLSAAVDALSKHPLPWFPPYSVDLAEHSHEAVERSGDAGDQDYLHWQQFHGCRPAFAFEMCPCERPVVEGRFDGQSITEDEDYNRRRSISREIEELSRDIEHLQLGEYKVPTTAEITAAIWEGTDHVISKNEPPASQGNDQGENLRFPAPEMPNHPAGLNPEAASFEMSGALPDPQSQPQDHDAEDARPTLRGGGGSSYAPTDCSRTGEPENAQPKERKTKRTCTICPWPGSAWRSVMDAWR